MFYRQLNSSLDGLLFLYSPPKRLAISTILIAIGSYYYYFHWDWVITARHQASSS
jgi:hypothetical protein